MIRVPLLSIVIPTYRERDNIEVLFKEIREKISTKDYEIVLVDDNSPDYTWAEALKHIDSRDVVVRRINMRGLSSAIIDGILFSLSIYAVVMDADLQHPPEAVNTMVAKLSKCDYDIIIGSRYTQGGGIAGWSKTRLFISRSATLIAKIMLPSVRKISDPMSGFFMVKRDLVKSNREKLNPLGFKILLEILEKCRPSRVAEIPYVFRPRLRGESKLGAKTVIAYLIHVLKLSGWRPIKFITVGASGAIVNLLVLWLISIAIPVLAYELFAVGSAIAIEMSIIYNFILHEVWTFKDRRVGAAINRLILFHLAVLPGVVAQFISAISTRYGLGVNPLLAQLIGILIGFPVNYIVSELGIWRAYKT